MKNLIIIICIVLGTISAWASIALLTDARHTFLPLNLILGINTKPNDIYIINLWSSSCKPCMQELPQLAKMAKSNIHIYTLGNEDVRILDRVKARIAGSEHITWLNKVSGEAHEAIAENAVSKNGLFSKNVIPTTLIVKNDKILKTFQGYGPESMSDLKKVLEANSR